MNTAVDTTPIPDAAATALAPGAVVLDEFVEAFHHRISERDAAGDDLFDREVAAGDQIDKPRPQGDVVAPATDEADALLA